MIIKRNKIKNLKLYSEYLEEKEFDFNPYSFTNLKRAAKIKIGRIRKNLAGKLDTNIYENLCNNVELNENTLKNKPEQNLDSFKKSENLLKNRDDIGTLQANIPIPGTINRKDIERDGADPNKYLKNNQSNLIVYSPNSLGGELLHELNHIKNEKGENGIISKIINSKATDYNESRKYKAVTKLLVERNKRNRKKYNSTLEDTGLKESAKRYIYGKFRNKEENNATRFSIKDMKKLGIDENIIRNEKAYLEKMGDTYKPISNVYWKIPLRNKIQIPSRRGDFGSHVYHLK